MAFLGGIFSDKQPAETGLSDLELLGRASRGDLSGGLSSGDKLIALSNLMRSMTRSGREAGITPGDVVGNIQKQQIDAIKNRLAIEQMKAEQAQRAALRASQAALVATLPKTFQDQAAAMDPEKLGAYLSTLRMNPSYKNVTENGKTVTKVTYQQSGLVEDAPFQLPPDLEKGFLNGKAVWFNKDTGLPHIDPTTGQPVPAGDPMTPKEAADVAARTESLAIRRMNANRPRGGGGGASPTTEPKMVIIDGKQVMAQWDKSAGRYVPFTRQNVSRPQGGTGSDRGLFPTK